MSRAPALILIALAAGCGDDSSGTDGGGGDGGVRDLAVARDLAGVDLAGADLAGQGGLPWSGIIDPARATDWSGAGVPGGIPSRATSCATLAPGATADQISQAIAACPSGQVVTLQAGTYALSNGISFDGKSGVTLRGAGADQTKL